MDNKFNTALNDALEKEFAWLENFKNPEEEYTFSQDFEENMNKIFAMPEYTYVSVGKRRIRKSVLAVLIALLVFAAAGYAAVTGYLIVTWHETQNDSQGTLDVTFDIENSSRKDTKFRCITPKTPAGYKAAVEQRDKTTYFLKYTNKENQVIYYSQNSDVENMSISIDNETAHFKETMINGCKGYSYKKDGVSELIWTDGVYLYTLQGTCKTEILEEMSRDISSTK